MAQQPAMTARATGHGASASTYRVITRRLIPLLMLCYVFAALDRTNIGFAKLQMAADIGISEVMYGLGAGIFFLGYALFEVPSNLLLTRIGTRKTLVRIMILWGLTSCAMMLLQETWQFLALRFLLGVFEAGFAPGVIFYLSRWYPASRLAAPLALFMLAGPVASLLGSPLSTWIMTAMDGAWGLAGWHWMFLLEGLPTIVLGVVLGLVLKECPDDAPWLTPAQKQQVSADLAAAERHRDTHEFGQVLRDPRVYGLAISYFFLIAGMYAVIFWLPTILADAGVENVMTIGVLNALPYAAAIVVMILASRNSDRTGDRRLHSGLLAIAAAATMSIAALTTGDIVIAMLAIILSTAASWGAYAVFWAIPSSYLSGRAAAGGIALINSIGLLGGFLSPYLLGLTKQMTGSSAPGLFILVGMLAAAGIGILAMRIPTDSRTHGRTSAQEQA